MDSARELTTDKTNKRVEDERDRFFGLFPDLLCTVDSSGRFQRVSPAFTRVLGWTENDLVGSRVVDFVHPDDRARTLEFANEMRAGQPAIQFENRCLRREGYCWISWNGNATADTTFYLIRRDITDERHTRDTLARQAALLDHAMEPMFTWELGGPITYWNHAAEQLYHYSAAEAIGRRSHDLLRTRFPDAMTPEAFDAHLHEARRWRGELLHATRDGRAVWVDSEHTVIQVDGRLLVLEANRDITDRKRAEEALRASEERFRALSSASPVGKFEADLSGNVTYANPRLAQIWQAPESEILGRRWTRRVHPGDLPALLESWLSAMRQGRDYEHEYRLILPGGEIGWVHGRSVMMRDAAGVAVGLIGKIDDITDRKRAEAELRELASTLERRIEERTRALEEANRELEAFGYSVSHDLRAPLRTMQGFSQALLEDYPHLLPPEAQRYLERIAIAAKQMDQLIQDLLAYSRLSRADLQLQLVDLSNALRQACQQLETVSKEAHAVIEVKHPLGKALGHFNTLVQVFANLISNAIKFVRPGETPHVRIYSEARDGMVRVWVEDRGLGSSRNIGIVSLKYFSVCTAWRLIQEPALV